MAKITLVAVLIVCMAMMTYAGPLKETRALKVLKAIRDNSLSEEHIGFLYIIFDKNSDGGLDTEEISMMFVTMLEMDKGTADFLAQALLQKDTNGDQKISKEELKAILDEHNS